MTIIGRVTYLADIDGKKLPAQARRVGKAAGQSLGDEMGEGFENHFDRYLGRIGKSVATRMRDAGRLGGVSFIDALERSVGSKLGKLNDDLADVFADTDGVRKFVSSFDDASEGVEELRGKLLALRQAGGLNDAQFRDLANTVNQYAADLDVAEARTIDTRRAQADMHVTTNRLNMALDELANDKLAKVNAEQMRNLRFNVQLTEQFEKHRDSVIAAAEAHKVQQAALTKTTKETDRATAASDRHTAAIGRQDSSYRRLPHGLRQAIFYTGLFAAMGDEIAILGSVAGSSLTVLANSAVATGIGVGVAIAAFKGLGGELSELPEAVRPAAEAFQSVGAAFDVMQDKIQAAAAPGLTAGFNLLKTTVEGLTPVLETFGATFGSMFERFAQSIAPGTAGFQQINDIIAQSAPIFDSLVTALLSFSHAFGDILVLAGPATQAFADSIREIGNQFALWTGSEAGRAAITEFFNTLQTVMPHIMDLVVATSKALASLVTPESIADFTSFLDTMSQFMPILGEILGVIGQLNIFNIFAEILLAVGLALQPIIPLLSQTAEILSTALITAIQQLTPGLTALVVAIGPLLPIFAQLAADLLAAVIPAILALVPIVTQLLDAVIPLLPSLAELAVILVTHVVQAVIALLPILVPLIEHMVEIANVVAPLMPLFVQLVKLALAPTMVMIQLLAPVVAGLIEVFIELISPLLTSATAFLKSKEGMAAVKVASTVLNVAMQAMMIVLRQVGPVVSAIGGFFDSVAGSISGFIGMVRDAIGAVGDFLASAAEIGRGVAGGGGFNLGNLLPFASGGVVLGPTRALIGEAGPEMVIPLMRPLSQVDPEVRDAARMVRGEGGMGGGRHTTIEAGAVQINTVMTDTRLIAVAAVDELAAKVG